jgi:site-specific recombinase XerD
VKGRTQPSRVSPTELVEAVQDHLAELGGLKPATFESFCDIWRLFARFCERGLGLTDADDVTKDHVVAFLVAPRAQGGSLANASRHFRRGSVRFLYRRGRELGLVSVDPTLDVILPSRGALSTRPLTDDESELCRLSALGTMSDLRLPLVWALAETTARISEIPHVRVRDLDVAGEVVFLAGGARTDPRWSPMTDWASNRGSCQLPTGTR